jgi:uncharacterized membrane protein
MYNEICHTGSLGSFTDLGSAGWTGLIVDLVLGVALIAGLALLVVLIIRHTRVPATAVSQPGEQPTAKEILQAQYARGEITREQYELKKQDIG